MNELLSKAADFLQQQIEIYGDELVFDTKTLFPKEHFIDSTEDWRSSKTLEELYNYIHDCDTCPLHKTRNKFVFGAGNPNADMMLVGEAPGSDEDRLGEPFVGKAGELLTKMLAAIKVDRKSVYIANILKCRPPQNRDPLPEEIASCRPYLDEQIELIQPKVIVCLGRVAAHTLLNRNDPVSMLRKQSFSFGKAKLVVTYHPAALLRNKQLKYGAWEDLQRIQRLLTAPSED